MKLSAFEFPIFKSLKRVPLADARLLIACSGGADSVALVHLLSKIAPKIGVQLGVVTVHHGGDGEIHQSREEAVKAARKAARAARLDFHIGRYRGRSPLTSEASLREFRHRVIENVRAEYRYTHVVFGHHADDLFETRMIRLLRGTGPQGLPAMAFAEGNRLRPLLDQTREAIRQYAKVEHLTWSEDASNLSREPLRNWLRLDLLPSIEQKRPGSVRCLARSLEAIVEMCARSVARSRFPFKDNYIDRISYEAFTPAERRQALASLLHKAGVRDFGRTHIEEIRKRIEVPQKVLQFSLLGLTIKINAEQIFLAEPTTPTVG